MRICLYVGKAAPPESQAEWLANAKSTCDVYASNLHREFTARGHEVLFASSLAAKPNNCSPEDEAKRVARYEKMVFPEADHAICLEQNGWRYRDRIFFEKARAATKGLICSICDHDQVIDGPQDILFTARRPIHPARARYIGWAADPETFKPEKDKEWLTIFIDHKYDPSERHDDTEALLKSATTYAAKLAAEDGRAPDGRRVQVVFFSPDGLVRIEPGEIRDVHLGTDRRTFYRRVPGPELAAWTRRTDIFAVTHGESMGLPVLENAMAGALLVTHEGFVKPELLRSLEHYEYKRVEDVNWDWLAGRLYPDRFRRRASRFTWGQVAQRMLDTFTGRDEVIRAEVFRHGHLLVAPPAAVGDKRFSSLGAWRAQNVTIQPGNHGERMIPVTERPLHYARRELRKHPWPETFTISFMVTPNGRNDVAVWLCGEFDDERAEVRFDLDSLEASPGRTVGKWHLLDASAVKVGDQVLCHMVAQSDWAPVLRCYVLLSREGRIEFAADESEPGLEIDRLHLGKGVGLIADVGNRSDSSAGVDERVQSALAREATA
jgi:hypothetical protein